MNTDKPILFWSQGECPWLSNFFPCTVHVFGKNFSCAEGAYQWAKTYDISKYPQFAVATGKQAKDLGKQLNGGANWHYNKVQVMTTVTKAKFKDNKEMRRLLLETGTRDLVHWSPWDTYWGVDNQWNGTNKLGKIIMAHRTEIAKELQ